MSQVSGYTVGEYGDSHRNCDQSKEGRPDTDGEANVIGALVSRWISRSIEQVGVITRKEPQVLASVQCLSLELPFPWNQKFIYPEMRELINNICTWRVWYMDSLKRHLKVLYKKTHIPWFSLSGPLSVLPIPLFSPACNDINRVEAISWKIVDELGNNEDE